jgi:riboflavin synthase
MFTGIIEDTGEVISIQRKEGGTQLKLRVSDIAAGMRKGDSLAVNGCCLTMVQLVRKAKTTRTTLGFDILDQTWNCTNLRFLEEGSIVNLERPMRMGGRLDGHFVTGHIEGVGRIVRWEKSGSDWVLEVQPPVNLLKYLIEKGSIAIDGISLTVAKLNSRTFTVHIIPHTFQVTNLSQAKVGQFLNLETDILGKYVERFLGTYKKR